MESEVQALIERSRRLGSDVRITNYAGGNTSVKTNLVDPVSGEPVRVLAVKGSGGDLGTMTRAGLAFLVLDRVRALEERCANGVEEDDIVALYDGCRFGQGGTVPSIDTPLHAFVEQAHVDHLHPDSMIALAAARDGAQLVDRCYGNDVGWLEWKRPGFELGLRLRDFQQAHPNAKGVMLGGHGMLCWADTSDACEALSRELIEKAEAFLTREGRPDPFGPVRAGYVAMEEPARRHEAAALAPIVRGLAGTDRTVVAAFTDAPLILDFMSREAAPRLAALGTSCPDHFLRTKVRPLLLDLPSAAPRSDRVSRLRELHASYRDDYQDYYETHAVEGSPAMRGADPAIVLIPGVGMYSFGADAQTARVAGEFYVNAINVMRGAESLTGYEPISDAEKFGIEYWELEERKLRLRPPAPRLQGRVALITGGGSGIGRAIVERLSVEGACVAILDNDSDRAEKVAAAIGTDRALAVLADVRSEESIASAFEEVARRFGGVDIVVNNAGFARSSPLLETSAAEWDDLHDVLARGSFLVSRSAARTLIEQGGGGDIVYVVSKNAIAAGPQNIAYGSAKADQAHQVRLLAAELGEHGIRVNGVNPDGVVRGSGIFSGDWLEQRAGAYGVQPEELGEFYAKRTLLQREILPEHVAAAVFALVGGDLAHTTGLLVPVDGGLPAAFLR